ncbi:MAG: chromosome segregation protein SMC [Nitrospirae bacterium]|nr:chromosome segregation protein SMC [Nitrospirota bacterium]
MLLKKLELLGFKSFCDKTTIQFQPGVTAVVGPNGCGKSNIADAILWVLGEQSAKTLRGEKMEDVIFNGTENKKSLGLSEVNLTLGDISTGQLSGDFSEYQEITITRRLYRSGESDYLINKIPCRLKDIRDLLIDTGAGAKGHTIIEQGKVDEILNSSPGRRREIIEETAGIAKYKIRRNEALRKLDSTQQNLLRVRDIMAEVKKQMNSLDRQARKAERYQVVYKEMRRLELALSVFEGKTLESSATTLKKELTEYENRLISIQTRLTQTDLKIEQLRLQIAGKEGELNRLNQTVNEKEGELQKKEGRLALLDSQTTEWREQACQAVIEKGRDQSHFEELELKKLVLLKEEAALHGLLNERAQLLKEQEERDYALVEKVNRHRIEYETTHSNLNQLITDLGAISARMATQSSRREEVHKRLEKAKEECEEVHQLYLQSKQLEEEEFKRSAQVTESCDEKNLALSKLDEEIRQLQSEIQLAQQVLSERKEALHSTRARFESLVDLQKKRAGYLQGIRALLKAEEGGELASPLLGTLADCIEVKPEFEKAIESVLNERLQGILIDSPEEAIRLIQFLKDRTLGKGLFLIRDHAKQSVPEWDEINDQILGSAMSMVTVRPGFEKVVEGLLRQVVIVTDMEVASRLWGEKRGLFTFVTLEGEVFGASGTIRGGSKDNGGEGLLQRQREMRERQIEVNDLKAEILLLEEKCGRFQAVSAKSSEERKELDSSLHQLDIEKATQLKQIEKHKHDCERLSQRELQYRQELEQGEEILTQIDREYQLLLEERVVKEQSRSRLDESITGLKEALQLSMEEKEQAGSRLTEIKIEINTLKNQAIHLGFNLKGLETSQTDTRAKIAMKEEICVNLANKEKTAHQEKELILLAISEELVSLDALKSGKSRLVEEHGELAGMLRSEEEGFRLNRKEIDEVSKRKNELDLKWTEIRLKKEHLDEFIQLHYQKSLAEALEGEYEELDWELSRTNLSELKQKIDQIGPVNITAIDEFKELEERFKFLSSQEADLTQSVDSLQEAIQKINKTTRTLFNETFVTLNQKFMEVFVSFFEGGKAEMILLDDGNPFESGVDIIVQPPGKKVRNVSMLSGGEKALTAIALLFASFLIHPSPFCILDEIDAPLDEENIRRFTTVLRKMTGHSQFIVITHNKRTMEIADILYGVTQEDPGISKLISVRMNQAEQSGELQPVIS